MQHARFPNVGTPTEKTLGMWLNRWFSECSSEKLWEDRNGFIFPGRELASHLHIFPGMLIRSTTKNSWKHQELNEFMLLVSARIVSQVFQLLTWWCKSPEQPPRIKYRSFLKAVGMRPSSWQQRRRFNDSIQQLCGTTLPPNKYGVLWGKMHLSGWCTAFLWNQNWEGGFKVGPIEELGGTTLYK